MADPRYPPIGDYALVSDSHSSALISKHGSVDWACFRRFDAPSTFARILDWDRGGFCSLRPVGSEPAGRRYRGQTMVLETEHRQGRRRGRTLDFFAVNEAADPRAPGRVETHHQLVRIAEAAEGRTEWELVCRPRFEFGIVHPLAGRLDERRGLLIGGPRALTLDTNVAFELGDGELVARFALEEGQRAWFALTETLANREAPPPLDDAEVERRLGDASAYWEGWAGLCSYEGPHRDDVVRSALVLKALTNEPSGAIVAAATTSLPTVIGGERNWDYRYCWIRDAAFTLYAELSLGYASEARDFIGWLTRTTAGRADDLQVIYGVGGDRLLPEHTLDHLEGYRGSRPVRVGNEASRQFQLDVYGTILDTAHLWRRSGGEIGDELWAFLRDCVRCIAERWREPDSGIWEVRGGPRHFTYSKAMAWVGVDRAIKIAKALGLEAPLDRWRTLAEGIRADVLAHGYDDEVGGFVQAYGSREPDASALLLPLVGFVAPDDPRMVSTVELIRKELAVDDLVHRYRAPDGMQGEEATFTICSFWLVDNLALLGRREEAQALFDRLCRLSNDVGLYAEQIVPATGEHLGNFPQAFTHLALINAAINLQRTAAGP